MEKKSNKPLTIVLIAMFILSALFAGGATLVTLEHNGVMGDGWGSGISWMWFPALLFLSLGLILGWVLKYSKKDQD